MKKYALFLLLLACYGWPVSHAQQSVYDVRRYGAKCDDSTNDRTALNALNTIAAVNGGTLLIPGKCVIGADLTFSANVILRFERGGQLKPSSTFTTTITGPIEASPVQIFSGAGTIAFTNNRRIVNYYPEWWGADGSDTTDDSTAMQSALTALPGNSTLRIPSGANRYYIGTGLILNGKQGVTIQNPAYPINFGGLYWTGSSGAVLELRDCIQTTIDGLNISLATGAVADSLILQTKISGQSTANIIRNCYLNAGTTDHQNASLRVINLNPAGADNNENVLIENNTIACSPSYPILRSSAGGSISASGTTLTCTDCSFVADDVGKTIRVGRAGAAGVTLLTTVASRTSSTVVELTAAASVTVTGAKVQIGRSYGTGIYNGDNANMKHQIIRNNRVSVCNISVESKNGSIEVYNLGGGQAQYGVYIHEMVGEPVILEQIVQESNLTQVYSAGHANSVLIIRGDRGSNSNQLTEGFYQLDGHVVFENSSVESLPPIGGQVIKSLGTGNLRLSFKGSRLGVNGRSLTTAEAGFDTLLSSERVYFDGATDGIQGLPIGPAVLLGSSENSSRFSFTSSGNWFFPVAGTVTDANYYQASYGMHAVSGRNTLVYGDDEIEIDGIWRPNPVQMRVHGTAGATLYQLSLVACDSAGQCSLRSSPATLTTANSTLSSTDFIRVTWPAVPNGSTYRLYRQNNSNATEGVLIATGISGTTYDITANPSTSYVAWTTIVPTYSQASTLRFRARTAFPLEGTFTSTDTTPSVKGLSDWVTANASSTSITTFDDGVEGQVIRVRVNDANTTFVNGATLSTGTGANITATNGYIYSFIYRGTVWRRLQ